MSYIQRIRNSVSTTGLLIGLGFFCISLSPSLLPRDYIVQGVLSGVVFTVGYMIGKAGYWAWNFLELVDMPERLARIVGWVLAIVLALASIYTLNQVTAWQNSIRVRMEMVPIDTTYPFILSGVACITTLSIILIIHLLLKAAIKLVNTVTYYLPRRIAIVLGSISFVFLVFSFVNGIIIKGTLHLLDESFAAVNELLDSEYLPPLDSIASGSTGSLISWSDIGRNGKRFVADGPTRKEIAAVLGREALQPIRVYAGFNTGETLQERAEIALAEMKRVGGFNRSSLIIATSTGTGWLDPSAVDTIEYIYSGDIATVTLQYSYLPSWLTLLVEPDLARQAANELFRAVFGHWTTLPRDKRPELYLYGLSLGALGSADSAELISILADPINGALWSGPPFMSRTWNALTRGRNAGSPQWLPVFNDSSMIRFMNQDGFPELADVKWGPLRIVYLQHASDPMSFFSVDLAYERPAWLGRDRGRDVSPYLKWFPVVSFFQIAFDIPMATSVPLGYGHNFGPAEYIDAWIEVTQPKGWRSADTVKLKAHFIDFNPNPL